MRTRRGIVVALTGAALWLTAPGAARAAIIVVPSALATTEGDLNNVFPFDIGDANLNSQRYQQVYASSAFTAAFGGQPQLITAITFRPDATYGSAFSSTLPNIQIDLSTTTASPSALSTTFAANVGPNDIIVRSGALSLSSAFTGPAAGPKAFDITIPFTTPFLYDPTQGDILLDVRNFGGGTTTTFDFTRNFKTITARVNTQTTNGVNDATGLVGTFGLVTQFTFQPAGPAAVPEPSSLALLALGGCALAGWRRWRGSRVTA